ncbi:MAG: type II secretion system protein [Verrucomicrobia bacterium]|nr:type II secretion system protein [Verrucomicrobiota bacterium]
MPISKTPGGFTLIELLVVIAVVAILAGLLLPVLGRAKEKGRQTKCLSNEKQIGLAFVMFADENEENYPTHTGWDNWGGTQGKDFADPNGYGSGTPANQRPLNRYAPNVELFRCPSDKGDTFLPKFKTSWDATGNSYRTQWNGNSFRVRKVTAAVGSKPITTALISLRSVNKIIAGEVPFHGNRPSNSSKSSWHNFRGRRGYNMLFGDGHAVYYRFPKEMDDPALWSIFTEDSDWTSLYAPKPSFHWW